MKLIDRLRIVSQVYMFPGVPLNTLANPQAVFNEVQIVSTSVLPKRNAVQKIQFTLPSAVSFTFELTSANGIFNTQTIFSSTSPIASIQTYLAQILPGVGSPQVSWNLHGLTPFLLVNFTNIDGPVDLLAVNFPISNPSNNNVQATVTEVVAGTEAIGGSFTLSFNGTRTIDMPYNVAADEMKACLEDLPGVGTVTVKRSFSYINGLDRGAYSWTVYFNSAAGNLPLLYATAGRLTPLTSQVSISVVEITPGSTGFLVYDGTAVPDVRSITVPSLISDMTYAFQVVPLNALGQGVLSSPSETVVATSGASASYTTVSGSSLIQGITGVVNEIQIITLTNCAATDQIRVSYGSLSAPVSVGMTTDELEYFLESSLNTGAVKVDLTQPSPSSVAWTVTFFAVGDAPLMTVSSLTGASCVPTIAEFLKGNTNQFTIEPKLASGAVLRDVTTAAGFAGNDLFLTESYLNGNWYRDQGVATYNPVVYEVQQIFIPTGVSTSFKLTDYLTPFSTQTFSTSVVSSAASSQTIQAAIESLANVESVDVSTSSQSGGVYFQVTFLSNLCQVPLLLPTNPAVLVSEVVIGICEIQTVTIASDVKFTREIQQFGLNPIFPVSFTLFGTSVTVPTPISDIKIQAALSTVFAPNGSPVVTSVSHNNNSYSVLFVSPVGNVPTLSVKQGGNSAVVMQAVVGNSSTSGTFTLFYEGQYTNDIPFDASAAQVKTALEQLNNIGVVGVAAEDTDNGFKWTVSFTQNVGNLRMMEASPFRYEIQNLWTSGGSPTPLSGSLLLMHANDSVTVNFDASADELAAALESMPSVGNVEVSRQVNTNGQYSWVRYEAASMKIIRHIFYTFAIISFWRLSQMITFRALIGSVDLLGVDSTNLFGSDASAFVKEIVQGSQMTLFGENPRLAVMEKVPGNPDYTGQYIVDMPGNFSTRVSQLLVGGLFGQYFDNQWFYGQPSIERIDPVIDFDWSTGLVTMVSTDYVSISWTGKLMVTKSELYTIYLTADDGANLYVNHTLLINGSDVCCIEHRVQIGLEANVYYDFALQYTEVTGTASVSLMYSSASVRKQIIPSSAFFSTQDVVGSPFVTTVVPGAADYPYTTAFGAGLAAAVTGTHFYIFL